MNKNQKITIPEDTSKIIGKLMKKYGIEESIKEVFDKLKKGEKTKGRKIANLIREIAEGKLAEENLSSELQKRLTLPQKKARGLAMDVKKEILVNIQRTPSEKPVETLKKKKLPKSDIYREPVE